MEPLDRIYAVMNLVDEAQRFQVDYTLDFATLLKTVFEKSMEDIDSRTPVVKLQPLIWALRRELSQAGCHFSDEEEVDIRNSGGHISIPIIRYVLKWLHISNPPDLLHYISLAKRTN